VLPLPPLAGESASDAENPHGTGVATACAPWGASSLEASQHSANDWLLLKLRRVALQALGLTLAGPEVEPTVLIDITAQKAIKVLELRTYPTNGDAQRLHDAVGQA